MYTIKYKNNEVKYTTNNYLYSFILLNINFTLFILQANEFFGKFIKIPELFWVISNPISSCMQRNINTIFQSELVKRVYVKYTQYFERFLDKYVIWAHFACLCYRNNADILYTEYKKPRRLEFNFLNSLNCFSDFFFTFTFFVWLQHKSNVSYYKREACQESLYKKYSIGYNSH